MPRIVLLLLSALLAPLAAAPGPAPGFPHLHDPEVPAPRRHDQPDQLGRIIVTVGPDGRCFDDEGRLLPTPAELRAHLKKRQLAIIANGHQAHLVLRGERGTLFQFARHVIRAAAREGINHVVFAVHRAGPRPVAAPGEVNWNLPPARPQEDGEAIPMPPLLLCISANGSLSIEGGPLREPLDEGMAGKGLPLLRQRLALFRAAAEANRQVPRIQLCAAGATPFGRVIEVVRVLEEMKFGQVTFTERLQED